MVMDQDMPLSSPWNSVDPQAPYSLASVWFSYIVRSQYICPQFPVVLTETWMVKTNQSSLYCSAEHIQGYTWALILPGLLSLRTWSLCCSRVWALVKKDATCDGTYWRKLLIAGSKNVLKKQPHKCAWLAHASHFHRINGNLNSSSTINGAPCKEMPKYTLPSVKLAGKQFHNSIDVHIENLGVPVKKLGIWISNLRWHNSSPVPNQFHTNAHSCWTLNYLYLFVQIGLNVV